MIRFRKLTLRGFKTFKEEQVFVFPQNPGLYRVTGRNEVHPQLAANDCGKSSLFDGLCWVLYGKTARGLKASDIVNWEDTEPTVVQLEMETEEEIMVLQRFHDPNRLLLNGEDTTQEEIDNLTLPYEGFLASVLMGQFNDFFFDLGPAEKLKKFDGMLGLERWQAAAKKAGELAREKEGALEALKREKAGLVGRKGELVGQTNELILLSQQYQKELSDKLSQASRELDHARAEFTAADKAYQFQVNRQLKFKPKIEERKKLLVEVDEQLKGPVSRQMKATLEADQVEKQLKALASSEVCPTCGKPWKDNQKAKEEAEKALRVARHKAESSSIIVDGLQEAYAKAEKDLRRGVAYLAEVNELLNKTQRMRNEADSTLRRAQMTVTQLKEGNDPYAPQLEKAQAALESVRTRLREVKAEVANAEADLQALAYWPKGFRDLRLWLVGEAVGQLTVEVSNSLLELGLDGWAVDCAVEKENKGGTVTRGFTVNVTSPLTDKPVKWEAWGGGVTQRLRVAGALGLASLARARTNKVPEMEVWDEPTAHLSVEGVKDLLNFFSERAKAENRVIFVIDHRSLSAGDFDGEVVVVKRITGSVIEQET